MQHSAVTKHSAAMKADTTQAREDSGITVRGSMVSGCNSDHILPSSSLRSITCTIADDCHTDVAFINHLTASAPTPSPSTITLHCYLAAPSPVTMTSNTFTRSPPSLLTRVLLLLLLVLSCAPSSECSTVMSALNLVIDVDRTSNYALQDLLQAYLLVQPNVSVSSTVKTNVQSIVDVAAVTVDFAVISNGLTAARPPCIQHC